MCPTRRPGSRFNISTFPDDDVAADLNALCEESAALDAQLANIRRDHETSKRPTFVINRLLTDLLKNPNKVGLLMSGVRKLCRIPRRLYRECRRWFWNHR